MLQKFLSVEKRVYEKAYKSNYLGQLSFNTKVARVGYNKRYVDQLLISTKQAQKKK